MLLLTALFIATQFQYVCLKNQTSYIKFQLIAEQKKMGVFKFRSHVIFRCLIGDFMNTFIFVCVACLLQKKILWLYSTVPWNNIKSIMLQMRITCQASLCSGLKFYAFKLRLSFDYYVLSYTWFDIKMLFY